MSLTNKQKRHLRNLGHELQPVILTGAAGLSPGLVAELDGALEHHELVKVRIRAGDRNARDAMIHSLCDQTGADLVQRIGRVALLWRPNPERRQIHLPAA
jgi:RNA-binding protein